MNVVFLDIDGVLNNLGSVLGLGSPSMFFDPVSVALVERLCREGDAKIVVSSSWRIGKRGWLVEQMTKCGGGILCDRIIGETPELRAELASLETRDIYTHRGREIAAWLSAHDDIERFVIVDDDGDMLPGQPFVKTTFEDGFRFRHYVEALRHLNPEHVDCRLDRNIIVPADAAV